MDNWNSNSADIYYNSTGCFTVQLAVELGIISTLRAKCKRGLHLHFEQREVIGVAMATVKTDALAYLQ